MLTNSLNHLIRAFNRLSKMQRVLGVTIAVVFLYQLVQLGHYHLLNLPVIREFFERHTNRQERNFITDMMLNLALVIPILIGAFLLHPKRRLKQHLSELGISKSLLTGVLLSVSFCLPMLIIFLFTNGKNMNLDSLSMTFATEQYSFINYLMTLTLTSVLAYGFFCANIFDHTRFGFMTTTLIFALVFSFTKIMLTSLTLLLPSSLGLVLYSVLSVLVYSCLYFWLFLEWNRNIWVIVLSQYLHSQIPMLIAYHSHQLTIEDTEISSTSVYLGNTLGWHLSFIFTAVAITIAFKHKYQIPFVVKIKRFW